MLTYIIFVTLGTKKHFSATCHLYHMTGLNYLPLWLLC